MTDEEFEKAKRAHEEMDELNKACAEALAELKLAESRYKKSRTVANKNDRDVKRDIVEDCVEAAREAEARFSSLFVAEHRARTREALEARRPLSVDDEFRSDLDRIEDFIATFQRDLAGKVTALSDRVRISNANRAECTRLADQLGEEGFGRVRLEALLDKITTRLSPRSFKHLGFGTHVGVGGEDRRPVLHLSFTKGIAPVGPLR